MKANTFYQEYHHQVTVISVYEDKRKQQYILDLDEGIRLIPSFMSFTRRQEIKYISSYKQNNYIIISSLQIK